MSLAEHVGQPVGPIEALEHRHGARHLDLFDEHGMLRVVRGGGLQPVCEVLGEPLEAEMQAFDRALLHVEDVVHRHAIRPRLQAAPEVELRQPRDDADQDLLGRVLGILAVPEHPQREAVDVGLKGSHQAFECLPVAVDGLPGHLLERDRVSHLQLLPHPPAGSVGRARCAPRPFDEADVDAVNRAVL